MSSIIRLLFNFYQNFNNFECFPIILSNLCLVSSQFKHVLIEFILLRLLTSQDGGEYYGLRPCEKGVSLKALNVEGHGYEYDPHLGSLFMEEAKLMGIDSTLEELVKSFVEGESLRTMISLLGEGGIGKTTLAKRVYDDAAVKEHFDYHAQITVSQSHSIRKLVRIIIINNPVSRLVLVRQGGLND